MRCLFLSRFYSLAFGLLACLASAPAAEPLWLVEKGQSKLYLIGSIHVLPRSVSPDRPALRRAFENSNKVYFETDPAGGSKADTANFLRRQATYPTGEQLSEHLEKDAKDLLLLVLPMAGMNWKEIQSTKPWFLALSLSNSFDHNPKIFGPGADDFYAALAKKKGKPVGGLETTSKQLNYFTALNDKQQNALLISTIEDFVYAQQNLEMMAGFWQRGSTPFFEDMVRKMGASKFGQEILNTRNRQWLPQLDRMIQNGESNLVIVGMAHLLGPNGLVHLLQAKGYSVRQL